MFDFASRILAHVSLAALVTTSGPAQVTFARSSFATQAAETVAADARVAAVAYRLNQASVAFCPRPGLDPGWVLQAASQFPARIRPLAAQTLGLSDRVAIEVAVPGGGAARAGLRAGDELLAIEGMDVPRAEAQPGSRGSYGVIARTLDLLDRQARAASPVVLAIRRAGSRATALLPVEPGCAIRTQLVPGRQLDAHADDRYATIATGLLPFARDDDTLAVIIGHELAHAYLRHEAWLGQHGRARAQVLATERDADYLGLYMASRAGYDIGRAGDFWRRVGSGRRSATHPSTLERLAMIASVAKTVADQRATGRSVEPDPRRFGAIPPQPAPTPIDARH